MKARLISIFATTIVLVASVQALYWPLFPKPGTPISWWQVEWLAHLGNYLGAPVLVLVLLSPLSGLAQDFLVWLCVLIWCAAVYLIVGANVRRFQRSPFKHAT
jgi:hypothetical protein